MGRNKMVEMIRPYFYWPKLSQDCMRYIKGCRECQKYDKANPPRGLMQLREIVAIPFERVAVDLVGPFPTAMIDLATRWPEAIPLKATTSRIVSRELERIFTGCGFPTVMVTDNGPQFSSKAFKRWLAGHGIRQVQSSRTLWSPRLRVLGATGQP